MQKALSIFDDDPENECGCGGPCCGSQTDPFTPPKLYAGTLGSLAPTGSGVGDVDPNTQTCLHGTGYYDVNGVWHCPSGPMPTCPAGQHPEGNVFGDYICAPNTCPPGTHMGWSTDGRMVVCTPNATGGLDPATPPCPNGYHYLAASGNCIRNVPVNLPPSGNTNTTTQPTASAGLFGLSPLMLAGIAVGGLFLLSSMGDTKGGK